MIKVVYFGHQTDIAGGEISLLQLIDSIDKETVTPEIIVPGPGRFRDEVYKREGIRKYELQLPETFVKGTADSYETGGLKQKLWNMLQLLKTAGQLRKLLKRAKPDILHTNTLKAAVIASIATFGTGIKYIYHDRTQTYNVANRIIHRRAAKVIAISDYVKGKYEGLDKSKIVRVYNGVKDKPIRKDAFNIRQAYGLQDDIVIGIVGRIVPWKGHMCFVDAALGLLENSSRRLSFIIVGSADIESAPGYEEQLMEKIKRSGFADRFVFMGYRSDVPELMAQFDVLVVASIEAEAFGRVIIEGQMSRAVVVASRIGGIPELIEDGHTGLLFEPGNAQDLQRKLEDVIGHPERIGELRERGYYSAHQYFNIELHSSKIKRVYEDIVYGS